MFEQPINRVSHVAFCVKPENFAKAVKYWEGAFGIKFDEIDVPKLGLRSRVSLETGIEVFTADPEVGPVPERVTEFLERTGGGVYTVVFGVADMDAAIASSEAHGVKHTHRIFYPEHEVAAMTGVSTVEETHLEPFMGTRVTLGVLVPEHEPAVSAS
jgi:4-hydroxyphenylpyruvate dioxygenase-like putative hemolysin